jgi:hypothetical protein
MKTKIKIPYVFITNGDTNIFLNRNYEEILFIHSKRIEHYFKAIYTQHKREEYNKSIMDWYWIYNDETTAHVKKIIMDEINRIRPLDA